MIIRNIANDIKSMKSFLIVYTLVNFVFFALSWVNVEFMIKLDSEYYVNWIFTGLHLLITIFFILYIWKQMPYKRKKKIDFSLMILFLGIIGIWIWLPNENEIKKLVNN